MAKPKIQDLQDAESILDTPEEELVEALKEEEKVEETKADDELIAKVAGAAAAAAAKAVVETTKVDTKSSDVEQALLLKRRDAARHAVSQEYEREDKATVSISPSYRPYLGSTAMISANGIAVYIPVNGRPYRVNKTHAAILYETLARYDASIMKQKGMADIQGNIEDSPGSLRFG